MGRVHVLPDALANQIAAGEVVERPASVVKELVENALDAEATRVFVAIVGGGRALVRVLDDGVGMGREDAVLALQRHATSKISTSEDLHGIETLGFRGEALPSIASVSRFRLVTREHDAPVATEVLVDGGAPATVRDAGAPPGTRIEVADLFYNVPARLKFQKQVATEVGHVAALMTAFALGHPHVHFRLDKDDKVAADYPVARRLDQRVFQVLGKPFADRLHEVQLDGPIRVRGYVSEPGFTRTNQGGIHTFVNGRAVRDRTVTHALVAAYGDLLQRGHFPQGVLYVHLDPQAIDVNVHPAKAEIRFVDGPAVHEAIVRAVRTTLHASPWRRGTAPLLERSAAAPAPAIHARPLPPAQAQLLGDRRAPYPSAPPLPQRTMTSQEFRTLLDDSPMLHRSMAPPAPPAGADDRAPEPAPATHPAAALRLIGQLGRAWLVCEGGGAAVFVDQAAASALLVATALRAALASPAPPAQPLLFPAQLELDAPAQGAANTHAALLRRLGVDLEPFGGRTWQVVALPPALAHAAPAPLVLSALTALRAAPDGADRAAVAIAALARYAPVRAGQLLDPSAQRELLAALAALGPDADLTPALATVPFEELAQRRPGAPR